MEKIQKVIIYNKPIGEILSDSVKNLRKENNIPEEVKVAYAGRLDPLATGLLLFLIGDECKKRDEYQNLEKDYEFEVLIGLKTDTLDLMGRIEDIDSKLPVEKIEVLSKVIKTKLSSFNGKIKQFYPAYSSFRVNGKPLYWWAREGRLSEISIPVKNGNIYSISLNAVEVINKEQIYSFIEKVVANVKGDFRQKYILDDWENSIKVMPQNFINLKVKTSVSSGIYIRTLSSNIAELLGLNGIAHKIHRTRIREYNIK